MDRKEEDDELYIQKYIDDKFTSINNLKNKHEIYQNNYDESFINEEQIQLLFNCYADKNIDEDLNLMRILGGETELIKYAKMNIKTGLSEFYEGRDMIVRDINYGNNKTGVDDSNKICKIIQDSFLDLYMLLLVVTALGSILFQQFIQLAHSINLIEGLSIIVASLLVALSNTYLGYTKMERNSELEEKLKDCKKNSLLRDKKFVERHPEEIKVGDILQLMPGTTIPADGIVIKGKELSVDESFCRIGIKEDNIANDHKISKSNFDDNKHAPIVFASKSLFHESLHISKLYKNKVKINDRTEIDNLIKEYKPKIHVITSAPLEIEKKANLTLDLINKLHENAETHRKATADETIPDSPIVLAGTNVMQGIGQMLVLGVGEKRYYERMKFDINVRDEEESSLQVKLDRISEQIKILATVVAVLITVIKWGRTTVEMLLLKGYLMNVSNEWKNAIKDLYISEDQSFNWFQITNYYINGLLLLFTILMVSVPEGLDIAAKMSMALSINKLIENGILVKNVRALESIGSLDRLVFDYTRGFTLNEITFQCCIINDSSHYINNNNDIVPNLKLNEMTDKYKAMLVESLYMDYYKELSISNDGSVKYFQSSQISEYDIATILLLKALKFEYNKDSNNEDDKNLAIGDQADALGPQESLSELPDDPKIDEPCETIWKIAFNRDMKLAIFLVKYYENNANKFRLWIKGHPYSVLKYCSHYFEDNERYAIKYNKESTFDSRKHIESYYKNSYKVMSYAYKDISEEKFVNEYKDHLDEHLIRDLVVKDQDLTLFFTYALSDRLDSKAERICSQLSKHNIKICVITKGDKKLANIITKKYLKCEDDKNKKEEIPKSEKLTKEEQRKEEEKDDERIFNMDLIEKTNMERYIVSGPEILKDWKQIASHTEAIDAKIQKDIRDYFKNIHCIFNCSEEVKFIYVKLMRAVGESTCVTGNFHEETQVLKESDVSIKMGIDSSYSAIDAANIVLQRGRLDVLMNTMIYGRNMIVNVKKFIEYQLTINFSIVTIIGVTIATNKDSPFTFVQLLMINLLMDTFAAIALAYQNPRESINKLKFTIDKKDPLINSLMWSNIILQSTLITGICLYIYYYGTTFLKLNLQVTSTSIARNKNMISGRNYNIDGTPDYILYLMKTKTDNDFVPEPYYGSIHMTIMFHTFILFHLFNLVNIRIRDEETIGNIIQQNLVFWTEFLVFLIIEILLIYIMPWAGFMPIDSIHWVYCLAFAISSSVLSFIIYLIDNVVTKFFNKVN